MKYVCPCGYVYDPAVGDPDNGIAPGTPFEDLPDDWARKKRKEKERNHEIPPFFRTLSPLRRRLLEQ